MTSPGSEGVSVSLVKYTEPSVIILGGTHAEARLRPDIVTIPGEPIVIEMALRAADGAGDGGQTDVYYYRTDDDFASLAAVDAVVAAAWQRIGLSGRDFEPSTIDGTDLRDAVWHGARQAVHIDGQTVLCPFLTLDGECHVVRTVAATLDGDVAVPQYVSNALTNGSGCGLLDPHIASYDGRYYMTMRADDGRGYVSVSDDAGRSWGEPVPWRWDDGEVVPMHTTMTRLLAHSDGLVLIYTRIRSDNSAVYRNRSPLHCADIDVSSLAIRRATERIIIPNRGFPVGDFAVWPVDTDRSYVAVVEWPGDGRMQNGDTWLVKVHWARPNRLVMSDGRAHSDADVPPG